jgi:hypothetical protein
LLFKPAHEQAGANSVIKLDGLPSSSTRRIIKTRIEESDWLRMHSPISTNAHGPKPKTTVSNSALSCRDDTNSTKTPRTLQQFGERNNSGGRAFRPTPPLRKNSSLRSRYSPTRTKWAAAGMTSASRCYRAAPRLAEAVDAAADAAAVEREA